MCEPFQGQNKLFERAAIVAVETLICNGRGAIGDIAEVAAVRQNGGRSLRRLRAAVNPGTHAG